ncbi:MAG: winged helix DNA-binding protein [Candidatus Caldarchaeum sp.]|nr:winged helix DNA-binding protein [Candidatus Caldarchaeum sp.]
MEALTLVFAGLFVVQTVIFVILYRRAVTRHSITPISPTNPAGTEELGKEPEEKEKAGAREELHASAIAALKLINEKGSVISSDVSRALNLSREHTARLMKTLYVRGLVKREGKPFRYTLTEKGRSVVSSVEIKSSSQ